MYWSDLGGHPLLHHYNYKMDQRRQAEILRKVEYARLVREAQLQSPNQLSFHRELAHWLGLHMVLWGQKLKHFGALHEAQPLQ